MSRPLDIVVARYNEDAGWTRGYPAAVLYNKGHPIHDLPAIPLPNVGREGHTYIKHIVDRYDDLADWTVFVQGRRPEPRHSPDGRNTDGHLYSNLGLDDYLEPQGRKFFVFTQSVSFDLRYVRLRSGHRRYVDVARPVGLYPRNDRSDYWLHWGLTGGALEAIRRAQRGMSFPEFWERVVQLPSPPNGIVYFAQGAEFAVSREVIRNRPVGYYERLLADLSVRNDPYQVWYLEFCWYYVFAAPDDPSPPAGDYGPLDRPLDRLLRLGSRVRRLFS